MNFFAVLLILLGQQQYVDSFTLQNTPDRFADVRRTRKSLNHNTIRKHSSNQKSFWSLDASTERNNRSSFINDDTQQQQIKPLFDPFNFASDHDDDTVQLLQRGSSSSSRDSESKSVSTINVATVSAALLTIPFILSVDDAVAKMSEEKSVLLSGAMNPSNFNPVCPASDGFYRFLQGSTEAVIGEENFVEFGPLIAGGLLRIRLELCVVESFFNEAVGPFIKQNGLSWILPVHETVETFIAGTIFSLASTFILVGSTKIISVIVIYADILVGAPLRLLGGFAYDRALGKPVTLDIGFGPFKTRVIGPPDDAGSGTRSISNEEKRFSDLDNVNPSNVIIVASSGTLKAVGETSRILREFIEALDLFVGRYLVLLATGYIGIKFLHFKIFPDFPSF